MFRRRAGTNVSNDISPSENLCKDLLALHRDIEVHFLQACLLSASIGGSTIPDSQFDEMRYRAEIDGLEGRIEPILRDWTAVAQKLARLFLDPSHKDESWDLAMTHLLGHLHFNPKTIMSWMTWVMELDKITRRIPAILTMCQYSVPPVFQLANYEMLRQKVAFFDKTLDFAFNNPNLQLGKRNYHIGKITNRKL
ncbi:hypothetical protein LTR93_011116 [Exophiala xenobiotica]|nr:hypothetical protein LTR93_011116 [Exophiala xenobiotica]